MSSEPHATQVNLLRQQMAEIPQGKAKRKNLRIINPDPTI